MSEILTYYKPTMAFQGTVSDQNGNTLGSTLPFFSSRLYCREIDKNVDAGSTWSNVFHALKEMPPSFSKFMFNNAFFKTIEIPVDVSPLEVQCQAEIAKLAKPPALAPAR
jgi:hypothetical protein